MLKQKKDILIWESKILQIIMGQWLGVLPNADKKYSFFTTYRVPKNIEDVSLHTKISKIQQEKIQIEFIKLLKSFNLEASFYEIKDFNLENNSFSCYMKENNQVAVIQFLFRDFIYFPSDFIVLFHGVKSRYHFVTDFYLKDHILVSLDEEYSNLRQRLNRNLYKIEIPKKSLTLEIEYAKQLNSLDKTQEFIDTDRLISELPYQKEINLVLNGCLLKSKNQYRKVTVNTKNMDIEDIFTQENESFLSNYKEKRKIKNKRM